MALEIGPVKTFSPMMRLRVTEVLATLLGKKDSLVTGVSSRKKATLAAQNRESQDSQNCGPGIARVLQREAQSPIANR